MAGVESKVTSQNITGISLSASFNIASAKQIEVPTVSYLIKKISADFDKRIFELKNSPLEQESFRQSKERFLASVNGEIPEGFELVPVLAHPKNFKGHYEECTKEYDKTIQSQFTKFVAEKYLPYFKKMGVSKYVTRLMQEGFILGDAFYASIDHIIERSLAGKLAAKKAKDPNNKENNSYVSLINHFNNLVLIPQKIHNLKNTIRDAQFDLYPISEPTYMLMLTPKQAGGNDPEFMAQLNPNNQKFGIKIKTDEEVASSIIEYLNNRPKRFTLNKKKRVVALSCITEELNIKIREARSTENTKKLYSFFKNPKLHELYKKIEGINIDEVKEFSKAVNRANEVLRPHNVFNHQANPGRKKSKKLQKKIYTKKAI